MYRWTSSPVLISSCHVGGSSVLIQNSEDVLSFGPCASSDGVPQRCHNVNVSWSQCPHIGGPGPPDTGHITRKPGAVMSLINDQVDKILELKKYSDSINLRDDDAKRIRSISLLVFTQTPTK